MRATLHLRRATTVLLLALLAGCSDTAVVLALQFNRKIPQDLDAVCLQLATRETERYARRFSVVDLKASKPTLTVEPGESDPSSFELFLRGERAGLPVSWLRRSFAFGHGEIRREEFNIDPCGVRSGARFENGGLLSNQSQSVLMAMPATLTRGDMALALTSAGAQRFGVLAARPDLVVEVQGGLPSPPAVPLGALALNVMPDAPEERDCDIDVLVLGEDRPQLWVQRDGDFQASGSALVQGAWTSAAAADLRRDGRIDVVLGSQIGLALLLNKGGAAFEIQQNPGLASAPNVSALAVGLLDDDEAPDVLIGTPAGHDILLLNDSQSQAQLSEGKAAGLTDKDRETVALAIADLDGDLSSAEPARMDVVRATKTDVEVLLNKGNLTFTPADLLPPGNYDGVTQIIARDLNNDCTVDLVLVRPKGSYVLYNTGGGSFQLAPFASGAEDKASRAVVADLDGDGILDLVFGGDTSAAGGGTYWIKQVAN